MVLHIEQAQKRMGTDFEIVELDRSLHEYPEKMRDCIIQALHELPAHFTTVLVAMGYCGGSWKDIPVSRRIVIPKMDDCITMLLHTDGTCHGNLKEVGHMYFRDGDTGRYSIKGMKESLCQKYGTEMGLTVFDAWFHSYTDADIIDTGAYDCHSEEYLMNARENASLIHCALHHVPGSNLVLENLITGQWDSQFLVIEAGQNVTEEDFGLTLPLFY